MIIDSPKNYMADIYTNVCDYHKKHPYDTNYPGCTCTTTFTLREKSFDEIMDDIIEERGEIFEELAKM
jgi:hypothetical protein